MDLDFFSGLSSKDAKKYLENFLIETEKGFRHLEKQMEEDGIMVDYSPDSILRVFCWISEQLSVLPEKEDKNLPVWIRETESYKEGLYSFDESSNILILRFSYYLGECFIRTYENLAWSIGKRNTALQNAPVITGFKSNLELAPLLISKNMFSKSLEEKSIEGVESMVNTWVNFVS